MDRTELLRMMEQDSGGDTKKAPADVVSLGDELLHLKEQIDKLDEEKKQLTARYDEIRSVQLPEAMAQAGLVNESGQGKFSLSDGSTIYLRSDVRAHVRKADEGLFHNWLRSNGHGDLIKETVHPQTLKAFIREQIENGASVPDFVSQYHETTAAIRRGR